MIDYKKKYDEVLAKAKEIHRNEDEKRFDMEWLFPELKESEDERIRKEIIAVFKGQISFTPEETGKKYIARLEKQGEPNLAPKPAMEAAIKEENVGNPEPKFKVGDWITDGQLTCKVLSVISKSYELHLYNDDYWHFETDVQSVDKHYHLWTIKDAKNGDILTSISFHSNCTFIFNGLDNWKFDEPNGDRAVATGYCCLTASADKMEFGIQGPDCIEVNTVKPATKIQRDLLFSQMKEVGYEWDAEKKELKKIVQETTWSEEDECYMTECINAIATKDGWSFEEKRKTKHWLLSLKQRMEDEK